MITEERMQELANLGYFIEDMGKEHGAEFAGQYRWMNTGSGEFQDDDTSDSEGDAWSRANTHARLRDKLPEKSVAAIAESAINTAVREIQDQLGVETGDLAGMFFSGEVHERLMRTFSYYIKCELAMKEYQA